MHVDGSAVAQVFFLYGVLNGFKEAAAKAGPYKDAENTQALLAEHVEILVSQEHAKWITRREKAAKEIKTDLRN